MGADPSAAVPPPLPEGGRPAPPPRQARRRPALLQPLRRRKPRWTSPVLSVSTASASVSASAATSAPAASSAATAATPPPAPARATASRGPHGCRVGTRRAASHVRWPRRQLREARLREQSLRRMIASPSRRRSPATPRSRARPSRTHQPPCSEGRAHTLSANARRGRWAIHCCLFTWGLVRDGTQTGPSSQALGWTRTLVNGWVGQQTCFRLARRVQGVHMRQDSAVLRGLAPCVPRVIDAR